MRDLTYYIAVSIDGYIADASGGYGVFLTSGDHDEVIVGEYADALPAHVHRALGVEPPGNRFDTVLMGWNTLIPALDAGIGSPYPHLRQFVATRRARDHDPELALTDDPIATIRELKAEEGVGIWLCGGGALAGSVITEIDRLVLKRHPIVLGAGIHLFGGARIETRRFDLTDLRPFASGVVIEEYAAVD